MALQLVYRGISVGLRVPEDVSVVGFDGCELGGFFTPSLTTMQVPLRDIARAGTELLKQIKSEGSCCCQENIVIPPRLIVRDSTAVLF